MSALIGILLSSSVRPDERDDAAIDLGRLGGQRAVDALLSVARDPRVDPALAGTSGESLAEIALRSGRLDEAWLEGLVPTARRELIEWVRRERPDFLK